MPYKTTIVFCLLLGSVLLYVTSGNAEPMKPPLTERWVYLSTNCLVDKNITEAITLIPRCAKAGYTGIVLADTKFMRWDDLPAKYAENVRKVRQACRDANVKCIACVCPFGYSEGLLSHDPNLAEGLPVVDAPFVVSNSRLLPLMALPGEPTPQISNGGFEYAGGKNKNMPDGWTYADQPGKITFIDTDVRHEGNASLRMQDIGKFDPRNGHGRINQQIKVTPFHYYHISVWVKTQDFSAADEVRILALSQPGGIELNYATPKIEPTQDWKQIDITFNSLEFSQVVLYLGVWGGKDGKIWWDDVRMEPAGLVNLLRRAGTPLSIKSNDSRITYVEGKDFSGARDPKLGAIPWPGGYNVWHEVPAMTVPASSALIEGQIVRASYYHTAIIYNGQVPCCLAEEKVYEIIKWQIDRIKANVAPDGYFMQYDEIRIGDYDDSCVKTGKTAGQILADNVQRCIAIIRTADPGQPVYVWSDMFDPTHNAKKTGRYYLVKGEGPWFESWKGLDKDIIIVNWNSQPAVQAEALKFFANLGHRQILAGYYDHDPAQITDWLSDAGKVTGVIGVMYTTWRHNYDDLEKFAEKIR